MPERSDSGAAVRIDSWQQSQPQTTHDRRRRNAGTLALYQTYFIGSSGNFGWLGRVRMSMGFSAVCLFFLF
jgi:hypothetical protein